MPHAVSGVHLRLGRLSCSRKAHLNIFTNSHHGANERLVNLLAAAGGHDQAARRLL
jgi:hypothetical protein